MSVAQQAYIEVAIFRYGAAQLCLLSSQVVGIVESVDRLEGLAVFFQAVCRLTAIARVRFSA